MCGSSIVFILTNYDILKSNSPCILLNKNINFNPNETESKMENPTHTVREMNLALQLVYKSREFTLFRIGFFGVAHGWWEQKDPTP